MNVKRSMRPCIECPWRQDAQPQKFPEERYEKLRNTSRQDDEFGGTDAAFDAPFFACHQTPEGAEHACAGWLAVEGVSHVGVRAAIVMGRLPVSVLEVKPDWPPLYESFGAMVEAQGYDQDGELP